MNQPPTHSTNPNEGHCVLAHEYLIGFPELFAAAVKKFSEQTAVEFEGAVHSYSDLERVSNQIAHLVLSTNPKPEQRIGICLDRSFAAIAAMIGIFKAGCAFVPLDPEFPRERLEMIALDAGIQHIICGASYRELFVGGRTQFSLIDLEKSCSGLPSTPPEIEIRPDQLAYIMYTSGSTGKPKGVQIEHAALATYCWADIERYLVTAEDRTLQFSTLNFDIAIEEIFPPLLVGGSVIVRPRERAQGHNELSELVESNGITAIHLATAYWHEWVDLMVASGAKVPSSIRLMIVTGEKVSAEHFRRWKKICDHTVLWCNAYGPTEATVTATVFIPDDEWAGENMPIGIPLKRYTAKIVNLEGKSVSGEETGELLIGGPALARGYLNRPEQNEKAFLQMVDPKSNRSERFYRTGDLARWMPDGNIEFAGRIDHQIKIGSYRIEPGEIEAAINQHPEVLESLVTYDEVESKKYLIAYVAQGSNEIDLADMVGFLQERLPTYMVPTRFVLVENFPKTINGKIDRKALPSPSQSLVARSNDLKRANTEVEKKLCELWADVLNIPEIGIDDDFFSLGGSSLLVARVVGKLCSEYDIEIPVRDFFANPTIASIARQIEMLRTGEAIQIDVDAAKRRRELLPKVSPHFFGKSQLFGVHYEPVGKDLGKAVLICPAYGHEYSRGYRNLQQLAVLLAQKGCHVLRFDFSATGNSGGECTEANPKKWIDDISTAALHLRQLSGVDSISLVGLRLGATLASLSATENVEHSIYWDPIQSGIEHKEMLDRFHTHSLGSFNRFSVPRNRSGVDQAYGYCMTQAKRSALDELQFASNPNSASEFIIGSKDYLEEPLLSLARGMTCVNTIDEIYWNDPSYAESAFSSPVAFKEIIRIVTSDDPGGREA